jgi:alkaline phosphatase
MFSAMNQHFRKVVLLLPLTLCHGHCLAKDSPKAADTLRDLQTQAIADSWSAIAHWGVDAQNYKGWSTHSNRLIPIYTFGTAGSGPGIDLESYLGNNSAYRDATRLKKLYDCEPLATLNTEAEYCDQTDITRLQQAALAAGRKYVFLIVFDGMDWQTTRAASIYKTCSVGYESGRGHGLHFQDYTAEGTSQFGFMVTSPHNSGTNVDVNRQEVKNPHGTLGGGYNIERGGPNPWTPGRDHAYLISKNDDDAVRHAYTDSSSSATSMTAGIKTFNGSINVDAIGRKRPTVAFQAQLDGYSVGAVSSVPISHATPAASYAHNVSRDDYQDLTRDLIGRPSIAHPDNPLPGLDVLIGGGYGVSAKKNTAQGENFVPGNIYLTDEDLQAIDVRHGGKYAVIQRTAGVDGAAGLRAAAEQAATHKTRLFGFFGAAKGHLPFTTADGDHQCAPGLSAAESYSPEDLVENPTLAEMAQAAITVLSANPKGFWLLVEAGDVDWANHDNNLDNSIGAVINGDEAVKAVTDWVEENSNWQESLVIVTADHGHYLFLDRPEGLIRLRDSEE